MRFETFVAARYLRSKRRNRFVSLITIISVAGVSVGVIALIVVMSVMTGFDNELRATIIGNRAHLNVFGMYGMPIEDVDQAIEDIQALCPEVVAMGPKIQVEALLSKGDNATGALVLGVDPEREQHVTDLATNLTDADGRTFGHGELPGKKEIVLGYRLARRLNAHVGDKVHIITAKAKVRPMFGKQTGSQLGVTVSGISQARMSDFDTLYAFVDIETANLVSPTPGIEMVHAKLEDPFQADQVVRAIESSSLPYTAQTWYEDQQAFFEALKQEKFAMFIILAFIILVAAFNITSTLIMIVMEKRRDIGILRTLGVSGGSILLLFIIQGLMIGVGGTLIGVITGTWLAHNLNSVAQAVAGFFGIDIFNSAIYYFDGIPVDVVPIDVFWITFCSIVLTLISTVYPAFSASRVNPVEALRYE